ncbi:hypothetical protein GFD24_02110 [Bifidobacterium ramosum]|uniref:Helix-turn-helix domain-containing protein n=1 Tax=Bifidobacterium ramosum TaxID=1798158 RepID=A0A7K3T914_9BIFI|nr:hypothetical protein [Bifidobacterium ramosum]
MTARVETITPERDDVLLTCEEVAAMLGISTGALAVRRYRGTGPAFVKLPGKQGGNMRDTRRVRYPRSCVIAWCMSGGLQYQTKAA